MGCPFLRYETVRSRVGSESFDTCVRLSGTEVYCSGVRDQCQKDAAPCMAWDAEKKKCTSPVLDDDDIENECRGDADFCGLCAINRDKEMERQWRERRNPGNTPR